MIAQSVIGELQRKAFVAATEPGQWSALLRQLTEAFDASSAVLRSSTAQDAPGIWIDCGFAAPVKQAYVSHWAAHDPWLAHPQGHAASSSGRCFIGSQLVPASRLRRTAFHADFARPQGLTHVMSAMVEDGSGGRCPATKLSLFREEGRADFDEEQLHAFQALQPALRCAVNGHWMLSATTGMMASFEDTLAALPSALFVLGATGQVVFCNERARSLPPAVARIARGELRSLGHIEAGELQALLRMTRAGAPQITYFWTVEGDQVQTGSVHLSRLLPENHAWRNVWPGGEIVAVVRLDNREAIRRARMRALVQRHGLTPAEEKVLHALARGLTPEEGARELGVSMNTMRTHLRHVLQKVGGRRIGEVLNLL